MIGRSLTSGNAPPPAAKREGVQPPARNQYMVRFFCFPHLRGSPSGGVCDVTVFLISPSGGFPIWWGSWHCSFWMPHLRGSPSEEVSSICKGHTMVSRTFIPAKYTHATGAVKNHSCYDMHICVSLRTTCWHTHGRAQWRAQWCKLCTPRLI